MGEEVHVSRSGIYYRVYVDVAVGVFWEWSENVRAYCVEGLVHFYRTIW